jgi:hypothetical protein
MGNDVNFEPWIGANYQNGGIFKQKILVLGESHYCENTNGIPPCLCENPREKEECRNFTKATLHNLIHEYTGEPYMRTFTCFERGVFGFIPSQEQREALWDSVAFYNYIQFALNGPRCPIERSLDHSENAFRNILDTLMPDKVIVWGRRLYNLMPDWNGVRIDIKGDAGSSTEGWIYNINGKEIPCMMVHHPSSPSGKNWGYWHLLYKRFLNI